MKNNTTKYDDLLKKLKKLKINSDIFGDGFMNAPEPMWYKSYEKGVFKMIIINRAYTEKTGITLPAYYFQRDDIIWDHDIANSFNDNDLKVVRDRRRVTVEEEVKNKISGKTEIWVGSKYPRFDQTTGEVIGVHGKANPWKKELWDSVPSSIKRVIKMEI